MAAQEKHWTPILNWVREEYGLDIKVSQGITYVQQDEATKNKLREIVGSMSDIELSGKILGIFICCYHHVYLSRFQANIHYWSVTNPPPPP